MAGVTAVAGRGVGRVGREVDGRGRQPHLAGVGDRQERAAPARELAGLEGAVHDDGRRGARRAGGKPLGEPDRAPGGERQHGLQHGGRALGPAQERRRPQRLEPGGGQEVQAAQQRPGLRGRVVSAGRRQARRRHHERPQVGQPAGRAAADGRPGRAAERPVDRVPGGHARSRAASDA